MTTRSTGLLSTPSGRKRARRSAVVELPELGSISGDLDLAKRKKKRKKKRGLLVRSLSNAIVAVILLVGVTVVVVLPWRWISPPTSAFVIRARISGSRAAIDWVDWNQISPNLPIAVVASEDQDFPFHYGFDLDSIEKAVRERDQRVRGASTITQQVAKNLFLWPERSWVRKGLEAYLAVFIETLWPKQRILEIYMNIAQFGPDTFGVGVAAPTFFGVPAEQLSPRQSALLAAVLPSPRRMSVTKPSPYVEKRVAWISNQIEQLGGSAYLDGM